MIETQNYLDLERMRVLLAPTGAIQETAIDNGWGEEFLRLSTQFDNLTR